MALTILYVLFVAVVLCSKNAILGQSESTGGLRERSSLAEDSNHTKDALAFNAQCHELEVGQNKCDLTCAAVGLCVAGPTWVHVETCPSGTLCSDITGRASCEPDDGYVCPTQPADEEDVVYCLGVGYFPSLTDASAYYACSSVVSEAKAEKCAAGSFDSCAGRCVARPPGAPASSASPCDGVADAVGADPDNARLYYFCLAGRRAPHWLACPEGHVFSVIRRECAPARRPACEGCVAWAAPPPAACQLQPAIRGCTQSL